MSLSHPLEADESKGYHTEIPYTFHSYNEIAPINMNYVARINGYPPIDTAKPFRYLELGCGNAMSLILNAVANSHAEFIGVDLLPQHVEFATDFVERHGITNLRIIQSSFEKLDLIQLGQFDFISTHGVISWVSREVHEQMRHIVDKALKPGGYYYVSYNAMPGWADKAPLLELLGHFISKTVNPQDRLKQGLQLIKFLQENKARYFLANPSLEREIKHMISQNPSYLIHEYLNDHWNPFYFREIDTFYKTVDCQYIGNANFRDNYVELGIPLAFHKIVQQLQASNRREFRESLHDFITNNRFRKDVYIKQDRNAVIKQAQHNHDNQHYVSFIRPGTRNKDVEIQGIKYNLKHEYFDFIHEQISLQSKSFEELVVEAAKSKIDKETLTKHLEVFVALNQAVPSANSVQVNSLSPNYETIEFNHPVYEGLIKNFGTQERQIQLPSVRLGGSIAVDGKLSIVLRNLIEEKGDVDKTFDRSIQSVPVEKRNEAVAKQDEIKKMIIRTKENIVPMFLGLGILKD